MMILCDPMRWPQPGPVAFPGCRHCSGQVHVFVVRIHVLWQLDSPWESPWITPHGHGKSMGNPWEIHGKSMGNPWEIHGKSMGNPWEIHGFPIRKWSENGMDHGFTRHKHLRFMDGLSGKMMKNVESHLPTHSWRPRLGWWLLAHVWSTVCARSMRCNTCVVCRGTGSYHHFALKILMNWGIPEGQQPDLGVLENFKQKMETPVEMSATRSGAHMGIWRMYPLVI